ncbi:MAG: hypothetical protein KDC12_08410 [Flavobacteriales bacterium]|nr:hypothetical protein [Flavobacteriales bacterium]
MESQQSNQEDVFRDVTPETRERTKKMLMYFILFAVVMMFAGFTSGYIVMAAGTYMVHIVPPTAMYVSIALVLLSSLTMYLSVQSMKRGNKGRSQFMLALTLVLGIGFSISQYEGWHALSEMGMGFTTYLSESGQELYSGNKLEDITGKYGSDFWIHKDGAKVQYLNGEYYAADDEFHTNPITNTILKQSNLAGHFLVVLIFVHIAHLLLGLIYIAVNLRRIGKGVINERDHVRLRVNGTYWHFMGLLWIYLFVFLFVIH